MKSMSRALLALALSLSLALLALIPAQAQSLVITGRGFQPVNVRAFPGTSSSVIAVLPANTEFVAVGRSSANNWVQIEVQGTTGWAAAWLLTFSADTALLPVTYEGSVPLYGGPGPFEALAPFNVNLREAPTTESAVIGIMPFNATATALARSENGSWLLVSFDGIQAWVARWLVILNGDPAHLPVDNPLPVASGPTATPRPGGGATATPRPGASPTPPPTPLPNVTPLPAGALTVRAPFRVNVRSAPVSDAPVSAQLAFGEVVPVIGRNAGNNWLLVEVGVIQGWVARWVVTTSDNTITATVVDESTSVSTVSGVINVFGLFNVLMRSGPATGFSSIAVVPASTRVLAVARTPDSAWIKVSYNNIDGWIASWLLIGTADFNNLPVE